MQLDSLLQWVKGQVKQEDWISKVILFGSRARKRAEATSDYDLAFEVDPGIPNIDFLFAEFVGLLREKQPTLNQLDCIRLDKATEELKNKIQEGVVIYERP